MRLWAATWSTLTKEEKENLSYGILERLVGLPAAQEKILVAAHHFDSSDIRRPDRAFQRIGYRAVYLHVVLIAPPPD